MNTVHSNFSVHHQRGAIIVEIALFLPIFFAALFILIWYGVQLNAHSSLTSSVVNSVRIAATRGRAELVGTEVLTGIDNLHSGATSSYPELLAHGVSNPDAYYREWMDRIFPDPGNTISGPALRRLPAQHLYALAYAHEAIRLSVSGEVRYPCDPRDVAGSDPKRGAGCLSCIIVNPEDLSEESYTTLNGYMATSELLESRIALKCEFQPDDFLVTPMTKLFNVALGTQGSAGKIIVTRTSYFDTIRRQI